MHFETRLDFIGVHVCDLQLARKVTGAQHAHVQRRALIIELIVDGLRGFGEIPVLDLPNYSSEWFSGAYALLKEAVVPFLTSSESVGFRSLDWLRGNGGVRIGIESALVDLLAKIDGIGSTEFLRILLGTQSYLPHKPISFGVAVGASSGWMGAESEMLELVANGASRIKFKIDRDSLTHLPSVDLRDFPCQVVLDLNGSLSVSELELLSGLDPETVVEEPSYELGLIGYQRLSRSLMKTILLDETSDRLSNPADLALLSGNLGMVIKPFRFGSIFLLHQALGTLDQAGVSCYLGGMFETSIGRRFLLSIASHPCFDLVGDMAPSSWYYKDDIGNPLEVTTGGAFLTADFKFGYDVSQLENHSCGEACFTASLR